MLIRLYSDTSLLVQSVNFVPGINIIYGKYSGDRDSKDINGIGKSSLVRLINFMLLSDSAEKEFAKSKYDFLRSEQHSLTLEFEVNKKKYFIKRTFENTDDILLGSSPQKLTEYKKSEILELLSGILFPVESESVYMQGNRFRSLMQFFIKDDIQAKGRTEAIDFLSFSANAAEKATYNFFLLGLPTKNLISFNEVSKEYKRYSDALKTLQEKLKIESGRTVEEYRSEKIKIEANINTLRKRLSGYNFTDSHKEVEKKLGDIITKINEKSQEYHAVSQKLKNLRESFQLNSDIDTRQIQKLYDEVLDNFGAAVKKTLDEITHFKSEILENRNKFLVQKEREFEESIDQIFKELSKLEEGRSKLLKELNERGVLDKLESTYEALINEQSSLERQNQILIQVDDYNRILSDQEIVLSETRRDILADIQHNQKTLDQLRELFLEILTSAIFIDQENSVGYFDIKVSQQNRKATLPFKIDVTIPKSSSLGQEVLQTIAYDLMIFIHAIDQQRKIPDFLIHDGVFHGMSHKTMVNILNFIYRKHLLLYSKRNFQYIATFSEDEVEIPANKTDLYGQFEFDFDKSKIIIIEDIPAKMLFKRDIRE
jgi:uncharacterized protein YydD (DUF2326 family)